MAHALVLEGPSFDGLCGRGSCYQARREIRRFGYPTSPARPTVSVDESKPVDALAGPLRLHDNAEMADARGLQIPPPSVPEATSDPPLGRGAPPEISLPLGQDSLARGRDVPEFNMMTRRLRKGLEFFDLLRERKKVA